MILLKYNKFTIKNVTLGIVTAAVRQYDTQVLLAIVYRICTNRSKDDLLEILYYVFTVAIAAYMVSESCR